MEDKMNILPFSQKSEAKKVNFRFPNDKTCTNTDEPVDQAIDLNKWTGCVNNEVVQELLAISVLAKSMGNDSQKLNFLVQALAESEPRDLNESRLCLQASNLYSEGMLYLSKAGKTTSLNHSEFYMKSAIKLLRLHNETLETLSRYRRGGEQKVLVQHVNVNDGGQAIVGHVQTGGGG